MASSTVFFPAREPSYRIHRLRTENSARRVRRDLRDTLERLSSANERNHGTRLDYGGDIFNDLQDEPRRAADTRQTVQQQEPRPINQPQIRAFGFNTTAEGTHDAMIEALGNVLR